LARLSIRAAATLVGTELVPDLAVLVEDGRIAELSERTPAGVRELRPAGTLLPGGIDLQVNGAGGAGVEDEDPRALERVARAVLAGGAAAFLPTLISAPFEQLLRRLERLAAWIDARARAGATPLGIHLEGPFLELPGAHPSEALVDPSPERVAALIAAARGHLKLVTLAPDRPGAVEATRALVAAGACVALGHAAGVERFGACVDAGARLVTHLFNAMSPLRQRAPGMVGSTLDEPRLCASLILDGHHVDPVAVRVAWRALGAERTVLVTDSVSAAGMPDGDYELSGARVRLASGAVRDGAGRLAGSALSLAGAVAGLRAALGPLDPATVAAVTSTNPARLLGDRARGSLAPGAVAELALFDEAGGYRALGLGPG